MSSGSQAMPEGEGASYSLLPEPAVSGGRQWLLRGHMNPGNQEVGVGSAPALDRGRPASQRIQQSLYRLDQVLSPPVGPVAQVAPTTPPNLGASYNMASQQQPEMSQENTSLGKNLHLAPTPACDATQMPLPSRLYHSTLLEDTVLGEDVTVLEDPTRKVSRDLIMAFHRELSVHSKPYQILDMVLALEKCCDVQHQLLATFEKQTRVSVDQLLSELCLEKATWQLLHILANDCSEQEGRGSQETLMLGGDGGSDKELAEQLFVQDSTVRQAQLVVDWLEGLARAGLEQYSAKAAYFADNVCWENTLHDLTHGVDCDVLVTEMDPDAPTRQQRKLSGLDSRDEFSLNKHLFTCIRAGQLDMALEICVNSGQPLKALMLEGWKLHNDPNVGLATDDLDQIEGNEFRDVWKSSCWQMLDEPAYDVYEKAVFASLSGNVGKILPVCQTWYDHVWAYFKTMVDVQVEKVLRSKMALAERELAELPNEYWTSLLQPQQVFQEIETSPFSEVRVQSQSHFHLVQKYIILDDMTSLLEEMVSWLPSQPSLHRLRFMAHVGLIARGLGRVGQESHVDVILEAYVKALTDCHYQSAVALYAAKLPASSQVSSYAHLLAGVREEEEQRHCLELGKEAGLDIGMVTKAVVENIRSTGLEVDGDQCLAPEELDRESQLTELDMEKIRAINWLVFEDAQRPEAIRQGNALIRQFLSAHKFSAAQAVFQKIPADSVQVVTRLWQQQAGATPLPPDIASDLTELEAIQAYLKGIEKFNCWFEHFYHNKPVKPPEPVHAAFHEAATFEHNLVQYKMEYEQWQSQATALAEEASIALHDVLMFPGGWMSGRKQVEKGNDESLVQQLQALRQICIPKERVEAEKGVVFLAMQCLQLSDVVISEKYKLYKDFQPSQLRQLLVLLRKSALSLVCAPTTDELGYSVT